jgi:hypothetical protein
MGQAHLATTFPTQPTEPLDPRQNKGDLLPHRHWRFAGEIRPASGRWAAVEWLESKSAGWQTGLVAEERGGLTRKGGSMAAQTERRGATTVE